MLILLLGKSGQLGWELQRSLAPLGQVVALSRQDIDLSMPEKMPGVIRRTNPHLIINAAAYTKVDQAESQPEIALTVNGTTPGLMAEEARKIDAALIHYSTDYVFDGTKGKAYVEEDKPNPINVYGQSKLSGEQAIENVGGSYLILRTSWLYSLRRDSFVNKVLQWARKDKVLRIVSDQVGNPTWCRMLAEATAQLLAKGGKDSVGWLRERHGLYHLAGDGIASRVEWAQAILKCDPRREEQIIEEVQPALTTEFPTPAQRPLYSALACDRFVKTFDLQLPTWEKALCLAMEGD